MNGSVKVSEFKRVDEHFGVFFMAIVNHVVNGDVSISGPDVD